MESLEVPSTFSDSESSGSAKDIEVSKSDSKNGCTIKPLGLKIGKVGKETSLMEMYKKKMKFIP